MSPSTRARTRAIKRANTSESSLLLDCPDSIILHILVRVPSTSLAALACTCHDLADELVPAALPMRAAFIGQRLCTSTSTSPLAALRFAEKLAERPAVTIAADTCHTLSVDREGQVWAWGGHEQGPNEDDDDEEAPALGEGNLPCWLLHLGLGRETGACVTRPERMVLPLGLRVLEVAAGYEHSLLRCSDGHAWSCGVGEHGRLGHLSLHSSSRPMRIESLERVALVAAGGFQVGAQTHTNSIHARMRTHAHTRTHMRTPSCRLLVCVPVRLCARRAWH